MLVTIRGRLVVTDLIVQELSSGVVIHVVNRETLSGRLSVPPISSPVQLESVGLCIQLFKAETLVSKESTSVCMEEHVVVEHLSSNTDGNADEELYVVVQEDADGSERQAFTVVRSETAVAKVAGRLPDPPFMSEVQLDDVGLCIHALRALWLVRRLSKSVDIASCFV